MWHLRWWWKWHLILLVILCLMNCFLSVCSVGFPRKFWQRHAQKKCDRPAHLRSPSPDPSLVMVRQNHDACRDTGMHRGRLTPGPVQFLYPIPLPSRAPLPPCYTGASQPVFQYELCNLYKEIDLQWFFSRIRVQWWWVAVCCFVVFVQLFKPAPVSLVFWLLLFFLFFSLLVTFFIQLCHIINKLFRYAALLSYCTAIWTNTKSKWCFIGHTLYFLNYVKNHPTFMSSVLWNIQYKNVFNLQKTLVQAIPSPWYDTTDVTTSKSKQLKCSCIICKTLRNCMVHKL